MIRPPRSIRAIVAAGVGLVTLAAGCGGGGAPSSAPVVTVVTANSALAQVAAEVGGSHATVVDVVPAGANPRTAALDPAAARQLRQAAVVVMVGGGYQPALEAAAAGAAHLVTLAPTYAPAADGPWLDPELIAKLAPALADALSAANPAARATYANGANDVVAEMSSLSADFQNSLSDCTRRVIVTPDSEWSAMSRRYGITDRAVGASASPDPAAVAAAAAAVRAAGVKTVFSQPWVPDGTVTAAAAATDTKVKVLDTLDGVPAGGWPKGATYTRLMENDLSVITAALQCASMGTN
ncbi:metal ABC transporter substrate-binding protein [Acidiferrimicrobium sp. IK]|uniref:metal ABC transporter substrate-binding protein n=1 Tax=Acidiferrimicrobium sp. IK TaxID=2871700 RepID=UPI0021CB489C|nr:metal ABC transporter substrate-binding protein [Acidiferrimicrobium sp. IK]MCU4184376.1 metal ABC transporter substrate-binding protein [Acidiferrimicrobium sp. IK]